MDIPRVQVSAFHHWKETQVDMMATNNTVQEIFLLIAQCWVMYYVRSLAS